LRHKARDVLCDFFGGEVRLGVSDALSEACANLIQGLLALLSGNAQYGKSNRVVLADGRFFKANTSPVGASCMWTLAFGQHEDRTPTHGYAETREAAMAAFAKSWRRE
jgi:hypothetical protein